MFLCVFTRVLLVWWSLQRALLDRGLLHPYCYVVPSSCFISNSQFVFVVLMLFISFYLFLLGCLALVVFVFFCRPRGNSIIWCSYYYDLCLRALIFLLSIVHVMVFNIMMLFDFVSCVLYVAVFLFIIYMCHVSLVV